MKRMAKSLDYSDEELVEAIRQENDRALSHLYKAHYPMVSHFVLSNSGTEDEAKDIYQEAVIIFYEKVRQEHFQLSCQIKTFLYSVCRRLWLKRLADRNRSASRIEDYEDFLPGEQEDFQAEENETKFRLMSESLKQLGEPCRTLIEDFYIQNLSMQAIAEKFGYTNPENAKNQKYKCLMRLKKLFFNAFTIAE